jgi:hypothetical protein
MPHRTFARIISFVCLIAVAAVASAAPATQPASQPATRPATLPSGPNKELERKVTALTRKAIQLMEKSKLEEAEPVLIEALKLDPNHTTNLYNFACLMALRGKSDTAMIFLEKAAENGWTDFTHLGRDPDLKRLRDLPRYKDLVARKDVFQKRAAEKALAALKAQFGEKYLYELDEERKLIFATNTDKATLTELKHALQAQAASQWAELFTNKPDEFISVVLPSPADYKKLIRIPGVGGLYSDTDKILVAQKLGQVITHEFTHALHAADRAPLGQDHPIWIAEGLASMYEAARYEDDRLVPHDNFRLNSLQAAAKSGRLIPLSKLVDMKQPEFVGRANLAYGQSSSVMLYLYEQGVLREWYNAYKAGYDKDANGRRALETVTKQSLEDFEKAWIKWMTGRKPFQRNTGADGVVIGATLDDANDGMLVKQVLAGGPAATAGLRDGDLVVGIADIAVRDFDSFVPVLLQFKAGDKVMLKVRREGKYLDLPLVLAKRTEMLDKVVERSTTRPSTRPAK